MEQIANAASPMVLYPISLEQLDHLISTAVKKQFDHFLPQVEEDEYITRREATVVLGISLVTLGKWVKSGKLTAYRIASRIRFKRSEVTAAMKKVNVN